MRFTETVLISCAVKNWNSMLLIADATGSDGFMVMISACAAPATRAL